MDFCAQNSLGEVDLQTVCCRRCSTPLGRTTPRQLVVNGVVVRHKVVLECRKCGERRTWLPFQDGHETDRRSQIDTTSFVV